MKKFFTTKIGWLRMVAFCEGLSLVVLLFIAMPLKYIFDEPFLVKIVGMAHGGLFMLFVLFALVVSFWDKWSFTNITWKVLLSSMIPFGTFYVDHKILSKLQEKAVEQVNA